MGPTGIGTILSIIFFSLLGCQQQKDPLGVLARVDGRVITVEDFNRRFQGMKVDAPFSPGSHESLMRLKEEFLNQLIEEALVLKAAGDLGVTVTDKELEEAVMEVKEAYKGESLREYLNEMGISLDDWKESVSNRILIEKTIRIGSRYDGAIPTEEARRYYDAHRQEYELPERVRARHIVVASEREARRVLRELEEGEDFAELAAERSLGPESRFGGDLGYFSLADMPREFDVVFSMEEGQISQVIESPYGFHIFLVEEKAPPRQLAFEEIVDDIKGKIAQRKSEEQYHAWLETLKKKAKTEINHRLLEYTD